MLATISAGLAVREGHRRNSLHFDRVETYQPFESPMADPKAAGTGQPLITTSKMRSLIEVNRLFDANWRKKLSQLYEADTTRGRRFRYGLLVFDLTTLLFIITTSFLPRNSLVEALDVIFGLAILTDFLARLVMCSSRIREFLHPTTYADMAAIASFLAPLAGEGAGFLRVLRTLRLLRTYQILTRLRADSVFFRRNEDAIIAASNLVVFIFIMTAIVYETQHASNSEIGNYVDAMYFTVTALTTTGFGDITLPGTFGRLISVLIMVCGVTLFLNLARTLFQPHKVRFPCPSCGLQRHDVDAVHCKACGVILAIPDEGA